MQPQDQAGITPGQAVAVIFVGLVAMIQLNIVLTRNPGFWWWFKPSTAPAPSVFLLMPVALFLAASTFVGVYWPIHVQPDAGRGAISGAGDLLIRHVIQKHVLHCVFHLYLWRCP